MRRRSSTLTEQELEIMKVVWERDSVTVRDVIVFRWTVSLIGYGASWA